MNLERHTMVSIGSPHQWLEKHEDGEWVKVENLLNILYWLKQECRLSYEGRDRERLERSFDKIINEAEK